MRSKYGNDCQHCAISILAFHALCTRKIIQIESRLKRRKHNLLNKTPTNAKPAPSPALALIGRPDGFTVSQETRIAGMRTGAPTQRLHKLFRHIQRSLNFCLHAASQLQHPKGMCLNAALNKIAFKTHRIIEIKVLTCINDKVNVPEHVVKRNFIPHLRAPGPGEQAPPAAPSVSELRLALHYGQFL
jgi:hypothetical protein